VSGYKPLPVGTKATILRELADGIHVAVVAEHVGLPRDRVIQAASAHGYPDRAKLAWAADIVAKGGDPTGAVPRTGATSPVTAAAKTPTAAVDTLAALIHRAARSSSKRAQAKGRQLADLADRLTAQLDAETDAARQAAVEAARKAKEKAAKAAAQAAARAEVERLEAQLAQARSKLQRSSAVPPGARDLGLDPKAIRRWAASADVPCTVAGRVPRAVIDAYLSSHPDEARRTAGGAA
jgi:hypothetical protein